MDESTTSDTPTGGLLALYIIGILALLVGSAISAGLQVSLYSIDRLFLRISSTTGTPTEQRRAKKLLAVLALEHWTLVALILFNASCMMSLPILLERVLSQLASLIVSITAVLFLGEVVPLSFFVRYAIPFCAFFVYLIWASIVVTAPVSYPVGKLLDWLFGTNEELLDRDGLAALIALPVVDDTTTHAQDEADEGKTVVVAVTPSTTTAATTSPRVDEASDEMVEMTRKAGGAATAQAPRLMPSGREDDKDANAASSPPVDRYALEETEVKMLRAALQLSTDTIKEHLRTSAEQAFMLSSLDALDRDTISNILHSGYSRVPVYFADDRKHVLGALIVNSLVKLCFTNPDPPPLVGDYPLREVIRLSETASLHDAYLAFREGTSNMAVVYNALGTMVGLLTLTDVLAVLYQANPNITVRISDHGMRRQDKMLKLVKGLKYLNATNAIGSFSFTASPVSSPRQVRSREGAVSAFAHAEESEGRSSLQLTAATHP